MMYFVTVLSVVNFFLIIIAWLRSDDAFILAQQAKAEAEIACRKKY